MLLIRAATLASFGLFTAVNVVAMRLTNIARHESIVAAIMDILVAAHRALSIRHTGHYRYCTPAGLERTGATGSVPTARSAGGGRK